MNFKSKYEDYDCLKITQEEIDALRLYISSRHIDVNSILQLNPETISKQQKKGWYIDLSVESIIENIENMEKIYSAMYKYSKMNGTDGLSRLNRGTTINEIKELKADKVAERFLSTSEDPDVAMRFTEYQNGAMIGLNVAEGVPYIKMNEFLGDTQIPEDEVLLSPFSKIDNITEYYHEEGEVAKFSAVVRKQEFQVEPPQEDIASIIGENNIEEYISRIENLKNNIELLTYRRDRCVDIDEKREIQKELSVVQDKYRKAIEEFDSIRNSIQNTIMYRLGQVELSIDQEISKEENIRNEEHRKKEITRIEQTKKMAIDKAQEALDLIAGIETGAFAIDGQEATLRELATTYGVQISNDEKYQTEIMSKFETLKLNIIKIQEEIKGIEISPDATIDELKQRDIDGIINRNYSSIEMLFNLVPEMKSSIESEKQELLSGIRQRLNKQLTEDIRVKMNTNLQQQKEALQQRKISVIDRITGKDKLIQEQVRSIELKMSSVKDIKITIPENIHEIATYISEIYSAIQEEFDVSDNVQAQKINGIISSNLPVLSEQKMSARKRAKLLKQENDNIHINVNNTTVKEETTIDLPPRSYLPSIIDNAIFYTNNGKDTQTKEDMEKTLDGTELSKNATNTLLESQGLEEM